MLGARAHAVFARQEAPDEQGNDVVDQARAHVRSCVDVTAG